MLRNQSIDVRKNRMSRPLTKEREVLLNIIETYKDMPFLWDKEHKDYKNREVRNEGHKVLLEMYKGWDSNATLKCLTKKIDNLRTNHLKELKKVYIVTNIFIKYLPSLFFFCDLQITRIMIFRSRSLISLELTKCMYPHYGTSMLSVFLGRLVRFSHRTGRTQ